MTGWDWAGIGLLIWAVASVVVALLVGPVLRTCSNAREAQDKEI